jgi:hypothetical protein
MDFLGAVAVALAAGVLIALSPRDAWGPALKAAGVFAGVTIVLSLLLPPLTAALFGARGELRAYVPSGTGAVADVVGFAVRRGGVALIVGLLVARLALSEAPRVVTAGVAAFLAAALEVALQVDAIRSLATVFPPVVIANLLMPEVAPPLFGGVAAGLFATRHSSPN